MKSRSATGWAGLPMRLAILAIAAAATWMVSSPTPLLAQDRTPLLMEGRQTIYQRVLSRPGAILRQDPDPDARATVPLVAPFSIYYVFDRRQTDDREWVEVGRALRGPAEGWVRADQVIDWRQTMVVAFTNPANRRRTLFFDDRVELVDMLESEALPSISRQLRDQAINQTLPADSPVVSIEPAEHIDITDQFYVLPILEAEETWLASGFTTRLLRVASVPLESDVADQMPSREDLLRDFRVGIVFVIDTTNSMQPYIERTRQAVRQIYDQIAGSDIADRVSFGMVGFRDSIEAAPNLGYVTQIFSPIEAGQDPNGFLTEINAVAAADVSSRGFNEDSMAGLYDAINMPGWRDFDGRYIILITDAGPRMAADPLSRTGMGPREINQLAAENGIAIYTLHLLTDLGTGNHDYASGNYLEVSNWHNIQNLYHQVATGSVTAFGQTVDLLSQSLISQVSDALEGRLTDIMTDTGNDIVAQSRIVGRAMQLAYLGRVQGTRAPDVFEAWATDRDFEDPRIASLEVRVLLTKNQLSDLRDVLRAVVELGQANRLSPEDFFGQLQSAVAHLSRNPDLLGREDLANLGDLMGEYLQDLPYTSRILELDERSWLSMGPGAQREILDDIAAKLRLYEALHDRVDLWVSLYEGSPEGETVFPVPLEALP